MTWCDSGLAGAVLGGAAPRRGCPFRRGAPGSARADLIPGRATARRARVDVDGQQLLVDNLVWRVVADRQHLCAAERALAAERDPAQIRLHALHDTRRPSDDLRPATPRATRRPGRPRVTSSAPCRRRGCRAAGTSRDTRRRCRSQREPVADDTADPALVLVVRVHPVRGVQLVVEHARHPLLVVLHASPADPRRGRPRRTGRPAHRRCGRHRR